MINECSRYHIWIWTQTNKNIVNLIKIQREINGKLVQKNEDKIAASLHNIQQDKQMLDAIQF